MSLFFITGSAGTGKTTVVNELRERGYETYDADIDGLAKWQHNGTGFIYPRSAIDEKQRTPKFLSEHSWNFPRAEAEELAKKAESKPVFLCGTLGNEDELYALFKTVFALYVDDETLKYRLANRTSGNWGKQPHELEHTLEYHHKIYDKYRQLGFIILDASKPVETVADSILQEIEV